MIGAYSAVSLRTKNEIVSTAQRMGEQRECPSYVFFQARTAGTILTLGAFQRQFARRASMQRLLAFILSLALPIACACAQGTADTAKRNLSLEQQAKIADVITRDAGAPLRQVRFSLALGNAVPSAVQLRPVPADVETAAPQFRGASYVVVEEQIAIVDSNTRKILAVVQRGLNQTTGSTQPR